MGRDSKQKKLAVLQMVKERKNVLFASFQNNTVSKVEKEEAWKEILEKAQSLGLASNKREWTYARDHIFGLWKSRTLAKRDNANKNGSGSGKKAILDEVDKEILDILRTESPVVECLKLPEADGLAIISPQNCSLQEKQALPQCSQFKNNNRKRKLDDSDSIQFLKKQVIESKLYKNKLKILKLERELGLQPSKFTNDIYNMQKFKKKH